jgi:PAS domain S-box-containing protein
MYNEPHVGRRTPADLASESPKAVLDELAITFEELNVAEEELRTQNEELVRAQEALLADRARYRELFEHAPVSYFVTDVQGVITDANRACAQLLGVRVDRLRGKPAAVFTQDVSRRRLRAALRVIGRERDSVSIALNVVDRRGRVHRVDATVSAARDVTGEVAELRWLAVDQTRRAKREKVRRRHAERLEYLVAHRTAELERAQRLKDQLIATVSHEFRTALAAIGGYAELLEMGVRGPLLEPQAVDVKRIHSAYHHLARIVDDLLSYSKLLDGRLAIEREVVVLADALRGVTDLVLPQARAKDITLIVDPVDSGVAVLADAERLRQVALNLLGNAVKFTRAGGTIRVACRATDKQVFVDVSDTGAGVPADPLEAIFQPFVRLGTEINEVGSGLGLSISRDLARAMRGDLTAESAEGCGSVFTLRLLRSTRLASKSDERG